MNRLTRPTWLETLDEVGHAARRTFAALDVAPAGRTLGAALRHGLRWAAEHTGLPIVLVAAVALVVAFRVAKRMAHFAVELTVAVALVLIASKLGWIRW